jgi:hypothetical protein
VRPSVGRRSGRVGEVLLRPLRPRQQVRRVGVGLPHRRRPLHLLLSVSSAAVRGGRGLGLSLARWWGGGEGSSCFLCLKRRDEVRWEREWRVESNGRKVRESRMSRAARPFPFLKTPRAPTGHHHPPSVGVDDRWGRDGPRTPEEGVDRGDGSGSRPVTYVRFPSQGVFEFFRTFACGLKRGRNGRVIRYCCRFSRSLALRSMMSEITGMF